MSRKKSKSYFQFSFLVFAVAALIIGVTLVRFPKLIKRSSAAEFLRYESVNLGDLGGGETDARDLNNEGQIVGYSTISNGQRHAFLWENGRITDLGTLGGMNSEAFGINEKGQVVGQSTIIGNTETHAFLWENGTMTDLGTLGGTHAIAYDLNEKGQVVGTSYIAGSTYSHAFLWEGGAMQDVGTLVGDTGRYSVALSINETGQVAGYSHISGGTQHAFLWENGTMTDIGAFTGGSSFAQSINDLGQIVGYSYIDTSEGQVHAFLWEDDTMTDLGTLGGPSSGARSVNNQSEILGYSDDENLYRNTVIWENGIAHKVSAPGGSWDSINDEGDFVSGNMYYVKLVNGLRGEYYDNNELSGTYVFSRVDSMINFDWGKDSPDIRISKDNYSVRWEGFVFGDNNEQYIFYIESDDGVRLWVNGRLIIDGWEKGKNQVHESDPIFLYQSWPSSVEIEYVEYNNRANVSLYWSSPSTSKQLVPASNLYSSP